MNGSIIRLIRSATVH